MSSMLLKSVPGASAVLHMLCSSEMQHGEEDANETSWMYQVFVWTMLAMGSWMLISGRQVLVGGWNAISSWFVASMTVSNDHAAFSWLSLFIAEHCMGRSNAFVAMNQSLAFGDTPDPNQAMPIHRKMRKMMGRNTTSAKSVAVELHPGTGLHWFFFRRRLFWVSLTTRLSLASMNVWTNRNSDETSLVIHTFGPARKVFMELIEEARRITVEREKDVTSVYQPSVAMHGAMPWTIATYLARRPLDSVILQGDRADNLLDDVKTFLSDDRASFYRARGVPHRRGYLLWGPPGGGKSSIITAIAGEMRVPLCIISLNDANLTDTRLRGLLANAPAKAILVLEDVDAVFDRSYDPLRPIQDTTTLTKPEIKGAGGGRTRSDEFARAGITFSGLINSIDGVAAQEGRCLFMTTNKRPHELDKALIRPGRVDVRLRVGPATDDQAERLFLKFFSGATQQAAAWSQLVGQAQEQITKQVIAEEKEKEGKELQDVLDENLLSMASLQGWLIEHIDDSADEASRGIPNTSISSSSTIVQ